MLKVDLHCHSNISDGVLAPAAVAAYARKAGVDVWALTDHDEVSGVAAARAQLELAALESKTLRGYCLSASPYRRAAASELPLRNLAGGMTQAGQQAPVGVRNPVAA